MSPYDEAYNQGWADAVARLAAFVERERERMVGRELRAVVAQMALIVDLAEEMGLRRVWGFPVGPLAAQEQPDQPEPPDPYNPMVSE